MCGGNFPLTEFYRHPKSKDGYLGKCKACQRENAKNARLSRRAKDLNADRKYERERARNPKRKAYRLRYAQSAEGRERLREGKARWIERNKVKRAAHISVGTALRAGTLIRKPCEVCGAEGTQAHHDDYSKPLDVRWLCPPCHSAHHVKMREAE